jgi:phosphoribosylglycinamide formyltransferase-1
VSERLIAEAITPIEGSFDTAGMTRGEPGLPQRFRWRGNEYIVAEVLSQHKEAGPCTHGSGERYLRRHHYHLRTTEGLEMKLCFERGSRAGKARWLLLRIVE